MEITQAGRARVASVEFLKELGRFIRVWRADGLPEKEVMARMTIRVAIALASREDALPAPEELLKFVESHAAEINAAFDQGLATMMRHDADENVVH